MIVTKIEPCTKTKFKIYIDETFKFVLYKGEVSRPSDVTEAAIEYVKSFGYLDDVRYAENFVRSRQNVKSKKEIGTALLQKGISSEIAKRAMEICYEEMGEEEAIRKILRKKKFDPNKAEEAQMQKIYGYLGRKGFRYDTVRQVIQNYNDDA